MAAARVAMTQRDDAARTRRGRSMSPAVPSSASARRMLALQRRAGNAAVTRLLRTAVAARRGWEGIRPELEAGVEDERFEHEPRGERLLTRGSTGHDVTEVQARLNALGAEPVLAVDGIYGPRTSNAVAAFQVVNGLDPDGIVGPHTRRALGQAQAPNPGERVLERLDRPGSDLDTQASTLGSEAKLLGVGFPSNLKVATISLVTTSAGAAGGYPASEPGCRASLNTPGPFNDAVQGSIVNVHQVHVKMNAGRADQPRVTRVVKRKASAGGQSFDRSGNDGPPPHEFRFPNGLSGDLLVIADAPGWCRKDLDASRFPLTYSADFTLAVFDPLNQQVLARIDYRVEIAKKSKSDPSPTNSVKVKSKQP